MCDCRSDESMPNMWITVDWGDMSGEVVWYIEDVKDVWSHVYAAPGSYSITVRSRVKLYLFGLPSYKIQVYFIFFVCSS